MIEFLEFNLIGSPSWSWYTLPVSDIFEGGFRYGAEGLSFNAGGVDQCQWSEVAFESVSSTKPVSAQKQNTSTGREQTSFGSGE